MSVTFAPRARMELNAAWPGVSRKVICCSSVLPFRMREGNGVGADVLGDAAGFAGGDVGLADDVEQRGLAVVHVAHDGDDGRARLEFLRLVLGIDFDFLDRAREPGLRPWRVFRLQT